jgi:hypothetical protein
MLSGSYVFVGNFAFDAAPYFVFTAVLVTLKWVSFPPLPVQPVLQY